MLEYEIETVVELQHALRGVAKNFIDFGQSIQKINIDALTVSVPLKNIDYQRSKKE